MRCDVYICNADKKADCKHAARELSSAANSSDPLAVVGEVRYLMSLWSEVDRGGQ
jgi:hypothetical protein